MLPKCCAEHQKPDAFQRFCPTFQKLFLKRDFFDSFNGSRYRRLEGRGLAHETDETLGHEKTILAVRIQPSACTLCWAMLSIQKLFCSILLQ
jgi:hypothetical protein